MKAFCLIALLFICIACLGNDIDKLQTIRDVNNFINKKIDKSFRKHLLLDEDPKLIDTAKYGRNKFFKVDIDNNGLTDLLVYGYRDLFMILNNGKNNYTVYNLYKGDFNSYSVELISIDTLVLPRKIIIHQDVKPITQTDTLIFKFNSFIEYNPEPYYNFAFEKITLKTNRCFGTCPVFEMTINKDQTIAYKGIMYTEEQGNYKGFMPAKEFNELISLLKYLQFDKLPDKFEVNWTDDQTATTEVSYNSKIKIISDYGEIGSFGLAKLYSKFFYWRKIIEWRD